MTTTPGISAEPNSFPGNIDHIVYGVPDLAVGISEIEDLLGVRPVIGGRHPDFGTHNALVSLGPGTYLEIIAPDPDSPVPVAGRAFGVTENRDPGIITWALRTDSIRQVADAAAAAGVNIGEIAEGKRERPDGVVLSWQLSNPDPMPLGGAIPFLIDWGDTPHPAGSAPRAGELIGFRIEHPRKTRR